MLMITSCRRTGDRRYYRRYRIEISYLVFFLPLGSRFIGSGVACQRRHIVRHGEARVSAALSKRLRCAEEVELISEALESSKA